MPEDLPPPEHGWLFQQTDKGNVFLDIRLEAVEIITSPSPQVGQMQSHICA